MPCPVLATSASDFEAHFARLCRRAQDPAGEVADQVRDILRQVQAEGDGAVARYCRSFDAGFLRSAETLRIEPEEIDAAAAKLDERVRDALDRAADRIEAFHRAQVAQLNATDFSSAPGVALRLCLRPLRRVGIYVPGGRAAYPSTVLMNALPARAAGVAEVVMTSPTRDGALPPAVAYAARRSGVDEVYGIGGAQAIAALAYGTDRIAAVDKIVGPGNRYVAEAKRQVFGHVDIDQVAGPSEVLILADETARPEVVAADLLAQAEHDPNATAVLITRCQALAAAVPTLLERQLERLSTQDTARTALARQGAIIVCDDDTDPIDLINRYAPEHLGLSIQAPNEVLSSIENAGAIFVGHHTAEAFGDYNAGANHVLPTLGTARFASPLSAHDFIKRSSFVEINADGLAALAADAIVLAEAEGLPAHAAAIRSRCNPTKEK